MSLHPRAWIPNLAAYLWGLSEYSGCAQAYPAHGSTVDQYLDGRKLSGPARDDLTRLAVTLTGKSLGLAIRVGASSIGFDRPQERGPGTAMPNQLDVPR